MTHPTPDTRVKVSLMVTCSACGAWAGHPCTYKGSQVDGLVHASRMLDAEDWDDRAWAGIEDWLRSTPKENGT